jgi:hypothetical protein
MFNKRVHLLAKRILIWLYPFFSEREAKIGGSMIPVQL